jgi:hypothetical protein
MRSLQRDDGLLSLNFVGFWVVRPLAVPSGISNVLHLRPAALSIVNIHRAPDRLASVRWASASRMDTSCCAYPGSSARRNASEICAVFGRPPGFGLGQPSCVPCLVSLRKMGRRRGRISAEHQSSMALQLRHGSPESISGGRGRFGHLRSEHSESRRRAVDTVPMPAKLQ